MKAGLRMVGFKGFSAVYKGRSGLAPRLRGQRYKSNWDATFDVVASKSRKKLWYT